MPITEPILRNLQLEDGSEVMLGPDSAIRTRFTPTQRHVCLLAGMAFFTVRPDDNRPFSAASESLRVTTLAGAFDLSADAGAITVAVEQGKVHIAAPDGEGTLSGGQWLTLDAGQQRTERGNRAVDQLSAWRSGRLIADNETVASIAARIARWVPGKVVITHAALGQRRISGVFNLEHPRQALAALVSPLQGNIRTVTPWLTLLSPG